MSLEVDPSTVKPSDETVALANMWLRLCETLQQRTQLSQAWTPDYRNCEISVSSFLNSVLFFMGVSLIYSSVLVSEVQQSDLVMSDLCNPMNCGPLGSSSIGFSRQEHWSGLPSHSILHIHTPTLFQILFSYRILQNIEQSSLCCTVGPCWFLSHTKSCATLATWSKELSP